MGGDVSGGLQERCIYAGIAVASSDRKLLIYILSSIQNVGSGLWDINHCGAQTRQKTRPRYKSEVTL